ncbi:MAG: hypothetical protein J2P48_07620 [Alphaproteobacteria bacterium]|nr:hypothetical protein [Alphaproteobacteria bacterium]
MADYEKIDCGRYCVWSFKAPLKRRDPPELWGTFWTWAPRSACGTYWDLHTHNSRYTSREAAEEAARFITNNIIEPARRT